MTIPQQSEQDHSLEIQQRIDQISDAFEASCQSAGDALPSIDDYLEQIDEPAREDLLRDPNKEQYWRKTIQQQQSSGQTIRAFCAAHRISEHNFHSWRREIRKRDQEKPATPCPTNNSPQTTFVLITLTPALSPIESTLEIQLPNQITLRIVGAVDASLLASTLAVLREQS